MTAASTAVNGTTTKKRAASVISATPDRDTKIGAYKPTVLLLDVEITGLTDLIVNNFESKAAEMLRGQTEGGKPRGRGAPRAPKNVKDLFQSSKYIDHKTGKDCLPGRAIRAAIIGASRVTPGAPAMTVLKSAGLYIECPRSSPSMVRIDYKRCYMREDAVRNSSGVADIRIRAAYEGWSMAFRVHVLENVITPTQLASLIEHAGLAVGLAEWRPMGKLGLGGEYGRFRISKLG